MWNICLIKRFEGISRLKFPCCHREARWKVFRPSKASCWIPIILVIKMKKYERIFLPLEKNIARKQNALNFKVGFQIMNKRKIPVAQIRTDKPQAKTMPASSLWYFQWKMVNLISRNQTTQKKHQIFDTKLNYNVRSSSLYQAVTKLTPN